MDHLESLMTTENFVQFRVHILPDEHYEILEEGLKAQEDPLGTFVRVGHQMKALGEAMQRLTYLCAHSEVFVQVEPQENSNVKVIVLGGPQELVFEWVKQEDLRGDPGDPRRVFIAQPDNERAQELWKPLVVPRETLFPKLRLILGGA